MIEQLCCPNRRVEQAFKKIDDLFDKLSEANKKDLESAAIKPIHDKYPFAQNGICAMIATMGSGKTYNYLKLMAKQEVIFAEPVYELIVICSTSANFDKTVMTFKETITKSKLVCVKDTELLDWLNVYMRRMLKYNSIIDLIQTNFKKKNEVIDRMVQKHSLTKKNKLIAHLASKLAKYNWKSYPHRCLLILDDFASHPLIRSKETEMSRLLKKLRHFNINVIICVQTAKSIPKEIKRIIHDCILFPGISEDDFNDLIKEGSFGSFNRKELWDVYRNLKGQHDMMVIHIAARRVIVSLLAQRSKTVSRKL